MIRHNKGKNLALPSGHGYINANRRGGHLTRIHYVICGSYSIAGLCLGDTRQLDKAFRDRDAGDPAIIRIVVFDQCAVKRLYLQLLHCKYLIARRLNCNVLNICKTVNQVIIDEAEGLQILTFSRADFTRFSVVQIHDRDVRGGICLHLLHPCDLTVGSGGNEAVRIDIRNDFSELSSLRFDLVDRAVQVEVCGTG